MRKLSSVLFATLTSLALLLAGCNDSNDQTASSGQNLENCAEPDLDLMETELGLWLVMKKIPVKNNGTVFYKDKDILFYISTIDNKFDPCAELSWVTLRGVEQDSDHFSQAAFESSTDTIVFFHKDQLITDMNFLRSYQVTDVQIAGDNVAVTYEEIAYPRVDEGPTQTINYTFTGTAMKQETVAEIDVRPIKLDFNRFGPPGDAIATPLGNKYHHPVSVTYDENVLADVPMGDKKLLCNFYWRDSDGNVKSNLHCEDRHGATWPLVIDEISPWPGQETNSDGKTNFASIDFGMPGAFNTIYSLPGNIDPEDTFPDETVIGIGPYYVDTRGDTVKISDNLTTVVLGVGIAEKLEEPLFELDTSRYPTDLEPWN